MSITVREILAKSALTPSRIEGIDFALNPYRGCAHGCRYCYADFMRRFSGHHEPWGSFVDVKINIAKMLAIELHRASQKKICIPSLFALKNDKGIDLEHKKLVSLSTVTDPYQPVEQKYQLTRRCLEILLRHEIPVTILTKSPLICRDIDLIKQFQQIEVGVTITTDREDIRRIFEPNAPSIAVRMETLKKLHNGGIKTYVFIGPILPMDPYRLAGQVKDFIDFYFIDPMNYVAKSRNIYYQHHLEYALQPDYVAECQSALKQVFTADC
ncbi:MAG: radical SAM protein [candidate division KSB1 bacterium]|nr:radical SAM protein [candidate division KSB1 bacterium]MDZ7334698.1 radical SAM protein [candidate division KSB1 bacterium]MDZ7356202.1 radical SAM protein [candidate division KSB1 bacterium]MDZ7375708.1 radical SAM protein [candidate division KSB1 bacterium]MDZ7400345.1 radical SAM protein [candidate division KSB1 bacterium]